MGKVRRVNSYDDVLHGIVELLGAARRASARAVNVVMTTTYWEVGRRIVEFEQGGKQRAGYGDEIVTKLSEDLTARFGRGFGRANLYQMRAFYLAWPALEGAAGQRDGVTSAAEDALRLGRARPQPEAGAEDERQGGPAVQEA